MKSLGKNLPMRTGAEWKRMGTAVVSGLLLTAAFPKVGLDLLAWVALVPFLVAVDGVRFKAAFRIGFVFGLAHFLSLIYWIVGTMQTYGNLPLVLAFPILFLFSAYLALYPALFAVAVARVSLTRPALIWLATAFFWTAQEFLRARLFTGFPWELLGYSQFERIGLIQIADVTGVYGVTFLVALVNGALYALWRAAAKTGDDPGSAKRRAAAALAVAAVTVGGGWLYGSIRLDTVDASAASADTARITLVQGNIAQAIKWDQKFQEQTTRKYAVLSASAAPQRPDLVVWPETATPFYFPLDAPLTRIVIDAVRKTGADFLIGSPSFKEKQDRLSYFNSAYLVSGDGTVTDRYDKVHLVPFGEYVPFKRYLPFLGKIVEHVGDFQAGAMGKTLAWKKRRLGVLICYESIFPLLARTQVSAGADLLVNITNDAWYGRSSAPFQHFSMAVFRAVENRRWLVRAANTGISGFIDPAGRVVEASTLFTDAVMTRKVSMRSESTLYTRVGDLFGYLCLAAALLLLLVAGRRPKKRVI